MRPQPFTAPLLERQSELEQLRTGLQSAREGQARLIALCAEAGAGKSRLIEELRRESTREQFLWGHAFAATSTTPYAVWVDAIDAHLRSLRRRELLHVLGDDDAVRRLFAAVVEQFSIQSAAVRSGDVDSELTRLHGQMSALLSRLAELAPVCVVLDNLQWADRSSIELLHAVVRGVQGRAVLIVGAYRPDELTVDAPLASCLSSLEQLELADTIALRPLTQDAVATIVHHATGSPWPDTATLQLQLRTQGNALFVCEYIKHAIATHGGQPPADSADNAVLPTSIRALLSDRLRELHDDARRVLTMAAVIATGASYHLLRATTGLPEERLLDALDELTASRLLDEVVAGADVAYEFHKPLVQTVVYEGLGAARRQYLHRVTAQALMRDHTQRADPAQASRIARHLVAGAAHGRQAQALPYLIEASRNATAVFGNHEAVEMLSAALRVAGGSDALPSVQVELRALLGESYKRLGQFGHAVDAWQTALPDADLEQRAQLRRGIARALWQAGRESESIVQLRDGIAEQTDSTSHRPGTAPPGLAFLHQELAQALVRQGDVAGALTQASHALRGVSELEQPELVARIHIVMTLAQGYRGDLRGAFNAGVRAIRLTEHLPYPGAAFLAHYTLAALLRYHGDADVFEAHCRQCVAIAGRMHAPALETWPQSVRVERYALHGRLHDAVTIGEQTVVNDRAMGQMTVLPRTLAFLAIAQRLAGDGAASRKHIAEAARLIEKLGKTELRSLVVVESSMAYLDFLDDHASEALPRLEALLVRIQRTEPLPFYLLHPYVLPLAAECAVAAGQPDRARGHLAHLRSLQRGAYRPAEGSIARIDALILMAESDNEERNAERARSLLGKAIEVFAASAREFDAARCRVDLATALDRSGERQSALAALHAAGSTFSRLGAQREVAMVSQRLRKWGAKATFEAARRSVRAPISAREQDVVRLVATGKSNREIAAELFLSELTVETHMRNILRKLGLKSRAQVTSYATQLDRGTESGARIIPYPARS